MAEVEPPAGALDRLQMSLRAALVLLTIALVAAVVGGILLRPQAPVGYAATAGQPLLHRSGTGPATATRPVPFRQHAIGIGIRCTGHGTLRVELHPFGAVESPCLDQDTYDGGYVLSDVPERSTRWQVKTQRGNRWSLVLTQPINDGTSWTP